MTHLHPSYEPHRLGRLAGAFLMTMLILGTIAWAITQWQEIIS